MWICIRYKTNKQTNKQTWGGSSPLCLKYKLGFQLTGRTQPLYVVLIYLSEWLHVSALIGRHQVTSNHIIEGARYCNTKKDFILFRVTVSSSLYYMMYLWPDDGLWGPKHVVTLTNKIITIYSGCVLTVNWNPNKQTFSFIYKNLRPTCNNTCLILLMHVFKLEFQVFASVHTYVGTIDDPITCLCRYSVGGFTALLGCCIQ